jgi:hypothetical protein
MRNALEAAIAALMSLAARMPVSAQTQRFASPSNPALRQRFLWRKREVHVWTTNWGQ